MKRFEITYSDGKIYSGKTLSDWTACPNTGVQNITVLHDDGFAQSRLFGSDYYILDDDLEIHSVDILIPGAVKEGELIETKVHWSIVESVYKGGPNKARTGGRGSQGHSRIWNYNPSDPDNFEVGVRQLDLANLEEEQKE